ncbi:MAG: DNA translocase FtsK [Bacteroidales bacterium]|nr:DNA translocase FtsK [Bacteroidales bacterium]
MFGKIKNTLTVKETKWRIFFALALTTFAVLLTISFFSFFFTWENDQSELLGRSTFEVLFSNNTSEDPAYDEEPVLQIQNPAGKLGALLAKKCIHDWFGIGAFAFIFICLYIAGRLLFESVRKTEAKRYLFVAVSLMILSSLLFGFFANNALDGNLGGCFGYYFCYGLLRNVLGGFVTGLLLIFTTFIYVIFTFKNVLPAMSSLFEKWKAKRNSQKQTENTATEIIEEKQEEPHVQQIGEQIIEQQEVETYNSPIQPEPPVAEQEDIEPSVAEEEPEVEESDEETITEETPIEEQTEDIQPTVISEEENEDVAEPEEIVEEDTNEEPIEEAEEEIIQPVVIEPVKKEDNSLTINNTLGEAPKNTDDIKVVMQDYDPKADLSKFKQPDTTLLKIYDNDKQAVEVDQDEIISNKNLIKKTLSDFKINIDKISATVGPTITLYEIVPASGTKISRIQNLEKDIMMSLSALGIRIIAPIPGKGSVGIEVPNKKRQVVSMYSVLNSQAFKESTMELPVALGKTITNEVYMFDLAKTPHLLVAGATGQGKSVGLNAIVTSLLYKKHPSQLKFVLVDPKMVEFSIYKGLKNHYMAQYPGEEDIIIVDCMKVQQTLKSLVQEMEDRYKLLMKAHCRNIIEYNDKFIHRHLLPTEGHKYLSYIVIIIDEFGDFIMQAGKEIETPIARIAQKARAVGMHLILATQRPSVNIITGIIKANVPSRMAFKTASGIDSKTILDAPGAEGLVGRGDLLISTNGAKPERVQCAFVDTPEVERIVKFIEEQQSYGEPMQLPEVKDTNSGGDMAQTNSSEKGGGKLDPIFEEASQFIVASGSGSTSLIQRKFEVGYNRAGRIMDQMERHGIVGPYNGSKARELKTDILGLDQILNDLRAKGLLE